MAQLNSFDGYHVQLTDGTNTVGLKVCDERGQVNPKAIQCSSNPRTAMRVGQGGGYSDFVLPYTPITIGDWTGGRGQEDHEDDQTKWYDSNGITPMADGLILGAKSVNVSLPGVSGTYGAVFFYYRGALFCATQPDDESGSRLFINGWIGKIRSNKTANTQVLTSLNLAGVNLAGKTFKWVGYPGIQFDPNYCTIASNTQTGSNDTITLNSPGFTKWWDTRALFVVEGDATWNEITGHGLFYGASIPDQVESVAVIGDTIYFARGDILNFRRGRFNASSGAWEWADDTAAEGARVVRVINGQDGKQKIWKLRMTDNSLKRADPVSDFATSLTWTQVNTNQPIGTTDSKCTNMIAYDEPVRPFVFKEDEFGSVLNDVYAAIPLGEMRSVRNENNGRAALQSGVYLYFSMLRGKIQRYYNQRLDDVGPDGGTGLPGERQGVISGMVGYPARYFAAIDAGASGYSTVMCSNADRWFETYRASQGERIRGMALQALPGSSVSRMWIACGNHLVYMPVSERPTAQSDYRYAASGELITSWIYGQFRDLPKYWHSLKLFVDLPANTSVQADYQVDNETAWTALPSGFTTTPVTEVRLSATNSVVGKRIRFRFRLATSADGSTPKIKTAVIEAVTRVPVKRTWTFSFLAENYNGTGLQFDGQPGNADTLLSVMEGWADVNTRTHPINMTTIYKPWIDKLVYLEPPDVRPLEVRDETTGTVETRMIGRATVIQA